MTGHSGMRAGLLCAAALAGAVGAFAAPAAAQQGRAGPHDGLWRVLIVTERGDCDKAFRYSVVVERGRISLREAGPVRITGRVEPSGAVKVTLARGAQQATGSGRLSGGSGSGTWRGAAGGTGQDCAGRWEAAKEGWPAEG